MTIRVNFNIECNTDLETIKENLKKSEKYKRVQYGEVLTKPPCAMVGGGPSAKQSLDILREWPGDIYAVNDTAGFLSDNGVSSILYAIDCSRYPYKIGPLVKGALFASRVHRKQFTQFQKDQIRTFDLAEDYVGGATGGPTAICRSPMVLLRMGYMQIHYFGIDGSFLQDTHVSGTQKVAFENMVIIRVKGIDYLTNSSMLVQNQYMVKVFAKHGQFLVNRSGGLLKAMIDYPDEWDCVAVTEDLKKQFDRKGSTYYKNPYKPEEHTIWQPAQP